MNKSENPGEAETAGPGRRGPFYRQVSAFLRSPLRGKARRIYLTLLRPGYVRDQLAKRKGECRQCGKCCRLLFRCPLLSTDGQCKRYARRSEVCATFPIDERDLADVRHNCGYYFERTNR